jgi:hypothetical protein
MKLDEKVIDQIVETVFRKLADQNSEINETTNISKSRPDITDGVFENINICIQAACSAQKELVALPLEVRNTVIAAIRNTGLANAEEYGSMELEETGLGKLKDNVDKNISSCKVMGRKTWLPKFILETGESLLLREFQWVLSPLSIRLLMLFQASCLMPS